MSTIAHPAPVAPINGSSPNGPPHVVKKMSDASESILSRRSRGSRNRSHAESSSSALVGSDCDVNGHSLLCRKGTSEPHAKSREFNTSSWWRPLIA